MIAIAAILCFIAGTFFGVMLTLSHVETVKQQAVELQERNDRLTEAIGQSKEPVAVMLPRQSAKIEPGSGWWDTKPPVAQA